MDFEPDDFEDPEDFWEVVICENCGEEAMVMCGEDIPNTEASMFRRRIARALEFKVEFKLPTDLDELYSLLTMYTVDVCTGYWCENCGDIVARHSPNCPNPHY